MDITQRSGMDITQRSGDGGGTSLSATMPHTMTVMENLTKMKKHHSEPLMAHQAGLPLRHTPHPNRNVQVRWPTNGWKVGGRCIDSSDHRRHGYDFGYRSLRFPMDKAEPKEVPEMTLDELRNFLTKSHGSLTQAFDRMDFFRDGKLSAIEWQEGIYNTVSGSFGTDSHKYRMAIVPRQHFNARMQHLFYLMDADQDGLISFDELSRPYLEPEESPYNFTRRRAIERAAHSEEKETALGRNMLTGPIARSRGPPAHHADTQVPTPLSDFGVYILEKFADVQAAFAAFDVEGNGQLNVAEFVEGARRINYRGNAEEIFKLLDRTETGTIIDQDLISMRQLPAPKSSQAENAWLQSQPGGITRSLGGSLRETKRDATIARKMRSPIRDPDRHAGHLTLSSSDIRRPLGESMRTASGFHSFKRSTTGRLDDLQHPNELPGEDAEQFSPEHGPGFLDKGPEYWPYMGCKEHPRRGDKWKVGGNMNKTARFGALMPSKQAQADRELSGMSYATYEGRNPSNNPTVVSKICGTGAISWSKGPVRPGITLKLKYPENINKMKTLG